jgi:hypothetical protein
MAKHERVTIPAGEVRVGDTPEDATPPGCEVTKVERVGDTVEIWTTADEYYGMSCPEIIREASESVIVWREVSR